MSTPDHDSPFPDDWDLDNLPPAPEKDWDLDDLADVPAKDWDLGDLPPVPEKDWDFDEPTVPAGTDWDLDEPLAPAANLFEVHGQAAAPAFDEELTAEWPAADWAPALDPPRRAKRRAGVGQRLMTPVAAFSAWAANQRPAPRRHRPGARRSVRRLRSTFVRAGVLALLAIVGITFFASLARQESGKVGDTDRAAVPAPAKKDPAPRKAAAGAKKGTDKGPRVRRPRRLAANPPADRQRPAAPARTNEERERLAAARERQRVIARLTNGSDSSPTPTPAAPVAVAPPAPVEQPSSAPAPAPTTTYSPPPSTPRAQPTPDPADAEFGFEG